MAVFVDPLINHGWHYGPSCHLFADTLDELHEFAAAIGMKRNWFQNTPSLQHYDLTISRRRLAVSKGAIELSREDAVKKWRELRKKR